MFTYVPAGYAKRTTLPFDYNTTIVQLVYVYYSIRSPPAGEVFPSGFLIDIY